MIIDDLIHSRKTPQLADLVKPRCMKEVRVCNSRKGDPSGSFETCLTTRKHQLKDPNQQKRTLKCEAGEKKHYKFSFLNKKRRL